MSQQVKIALAVIDALATLTTYLNNRNMSMTELQERYAKRAAEGKQLSVEELVEMTSDLEQEIDDL